MRGVCINPHAFLLVCFADIASYIHLKPINSLEAEEWGVQMIVIGEFRLNGRTVKRMWMWLVTENLLIK
jgi:hypothetical protein